MDTWHSSLALVRRPAPFVRATVRFLLFAVLLARATPPSTATTDTGERVTRLSPGSTSYIAPSILQSEAKIAFRGSGGEIWVGDLDPATGNFASGDGRNFLMDRQALNGADVSGPQFGLDSGGWAVFYTKMQGRRVQTWRARWSGGAIAAPLTTGATHVTPVPARNAVKSQTRLLNLIGSWDSGGELAWYQEGTPAEQTKIAPAQGDKMRVAPGRWLDDATRLVTSDGASGQLFLYDTGSGVRKTITNDAGSKTAPQGWSAPEYDGETIVAAIVDDKSIGLYRDRGGSYWKRVATLSIPGDSEETMIGAMQAFVAGDKSYLLATIQNVPAGGTPRNAELWLMDLENASNARFTERCDDYREPLPRSNATVFVGDDGVYVYYNAPQGGTTELWRCISSIDVHAVHPLVDTDVGRVQGLRNGVADAFVNVPYAAAPSSDRRWRDPVPIASWSDVRVGLRMPPRCPQPDRNDPDAIIGKEDCLFVNLWTPADRAPGERLPVMVFVHGGGNRSGGATDPLSSLLNLEDSTPIYDGTVLSDRGNVVVVTLQYRLGALGYLYEPSLAVGGQTGVAGNYGLLDILEALRWLQRNVEAFGGDPDRVMLFGQSGGASNIGVLIASPLAQGLFSRALMESGAMQIQSVEQAQAQADRFIEEVGLTGAPDLAARLRALPLSEIVLADSAQPGADVSPFGPYVDQHVVDDQPVLVVSEGRHNAVPFVIGTNAAEDAASVTGITVNEFYDLAAALVPPERLAELLSLYPLTSFPSPTAAYVAMIGDQKYTSVSRSIAGAMSDHQSAPVFRCHFRRVLSTSARKANAAYHGSEKLYVFQHMDGVHFSANADDRTVETLMLKYWTRFAATGDPNYSGGPAWPRYDSSRDPYMILDRNATSAEHLFDERCDFWDSVRGIPTD